jgi:hypothetical protein
MWTMESEIIITIEINQLSSFNLTLSTVHALGFIHKHIYKYEMKSQNKISSRLNHKKKTQPLTSQYQGLNQ